jgi:hypothetical protein
VCSMEPRKGPPPKVPRGHPPVTPLPSRSEMLAAAAPKLQPEQKLEKVEPVEKAKTLSHPLASGTLE